MEYRLEIIAGWGNPTRQSVGNKGGGSKQRNRYVF